MKHLLLTKMCVKCRNVLPHASFQKRASTTDGLAYYCTKCKLLMDREYNIRVMQRSPEPLIINRQLLTRLFSKIQVSTERFYKGTPCWEWTAALIKGYGRTSNKGRDHYVHRLIYMLFVAPIPDDLVTDHLCLNTRCCNPCHLEPVTQAENVRRCKKLITHCVKGHPYSGINLKYSKKGARRCMQCAREFATKYYHASPVYQGKQHSSQRTQCPQGHAYSPENTIYYRTKQTLPTSPDWRKCKTCTMQTKL